MAAIDLELPNGCALAAGPVAGYPLLVEEAPHVAQAHPKRQRQFASGRHFARQAMTRLAGMAHPVGRDQNGRPIWPEGLIGSISHSESFAAAAVSNGPWRGIGIDVEEANRLNHAKPRLYQKLFTNRERAGDWVDPRHGALLFSAKEAAYKAVNPLVGKYIGYREVEAEIDWELGRLAVRYVGNHAPNRLLDNGIGHFAFVGDQVVTLLLIP